MIINSITKVYFLYPDEYEYAKKYEQENPDWTKSETTIGVTFEKHQTYMSKLKVEDGKHD